MVRKIVLILVMLLSLEAQESSEYKKMVSLKIVKKSQPVTLSITQPKEPKKVEPKVEEKEYKKGFFVGGSFGFSYLTHSEENILGTTTLDVTLEDYATNYGVEGGFYFSDDFFVTLNYQYTPLENVEFHYLYATFNHRFYNVENVHPYYGVLLGSSLMNWKERPIADSSKIDMSSSSILGAQAGVELDLSKQVSFFFLYKYIVMDYTTLITSSTEAVEIRYTSEQSFDFGLRYAF